MMPVNLRTSILLLELRHFKIISEEQKEISLPSEYHLKNLESVTSSVNLKADYLSLDIPTIAAEYFVRICCGHKLVDGNKRMAVASLGYFLEINNFRCKLENNALRDLAITLAHEKTSMIPVEVKVGFVTGLLREGICEKE